MRPPLLIFPIPYLYSLLTCFIILMTSSTASGQDFLKDPEIRKIDSLSKLEKTAQGRISYMKQLLKKVEEKWGKEDSTYGITLMSTGYLYLGMRDYPTAQEYLYQAIAIQKEKCPNSLYLSDAYHYLGMSHVYQGQVDKTKEYWEASLELRRKILGNKHPLVSNTLNNLGILNKNIGNYKTSEALFKESLKIRKEVLEPGHENIGISYNNLGNLYSTLGEHRKAKQTFLDAAIITEKALGKEDPNYGKIINNLGLTCVDLGDYSTAEKHYLQSLEIKEKTIGEMTPEYANSLENIGNLYFQMGESFKAESFFRESLRIRQEIFENNHEDVSKSLNDLGNFYGKTGRSTKAISYYNKARLILANTVGKEHVEYSDCLQNIGATYKELQKYDAAKEAVLEAVRISKKNFGDKNTYYANNLFHLANIYFQAKEYTEAEKVYLQVFKIYNEEFGERHPKCIEILDLLTATYLRSNLHEQSWQYALKSLRANTGLVLSTQISKAWIDSVQNSDYISTLILNSTLRSIYKLLAAAQDENSSKQQLLICNLALDILQKRRKTLTAEADQLEELNINNTWVLNALKVLDKDEKAKQGWKLTSQNKSILLSDAADAKLSYRLGLLPDSLIKEEQNLLQQYADTKAYLAEKRSEEDLNTIRKELNSINIKLDKFRQMVKTDYPKYAAIKYQNRENSSEEIQALLDEDMAMIEYQLADSSLYIFYIDREQIKVEEVAIEYNTLAINIKALHNSLSDYGTISTNKKVAYTNYTKHAHWFYTQLIAPVISYVGDKQKLIIIPDGELGYLPFEAFLTEPVSQALSDYKQLPYLVKQYSISYNYSAGLWKEAQQSASNTSNNQLLAIAANYDMKLDENAAELRLPAYQRLRESLTDLPAARNEVKALEEKFEGFFAYDELANEQTFKNKVPDYSVIHLAVHGLLDSKNPSLSSLAFTENSDSVENNFLQAYEISKMNFNANLVVLSACETGYGKFETGNGIASLARSFMYAGTPAMIVSLWQVNDFATSHIMENIYTQLANGLSKDEALRQAKLAYINKSGGIAGHPAFWSPFIMIGNTKHITIESKTPFGLNKIILFSGTFLLLLLIIIFVRKKSKSSE